MPAPQLTPPGHLDLHVVVVAATPAIIAVLAGFVTLLAGRGRLAQGLGWLCLASGIVLLAIFLRPEGVAASFTYPLAHGWIRVGPWQVVAAILGGCWASWVWRPSCEHRPWGWGLRTALALILPMSLLTMLVLATEADLRQGTPSTHAFRWRRLRPLVVLVAASLGLLALVAYPVAATSDPWPARLCMAAGCGFAGLTSSWRWALPLGLSALAALAPLAAR